MKKYLGTLALALLLATPLFADGIVMDQLLSLLVFAALGYYLYRMGKKQPSTTL